MASESEADLELLLARCAGLVVEEAPPRVRAALLARMVRRDTNRGSHERLRNLAAVLVQAIDPRLAAGQFAGSRGPTESAVHHVQEWPGGSAVWSIERDGERLCLEGQILADDEEAWLVVAAGNRNAVGTGVVDDVGEFRLELDDAGHDTSLTVTLYSDDACVECAPVDLPPELSGSPD